MDTYGETIGLLGVLVKIARGIDKRIFIEPAFRDGKWGFHVADPWGGDFSMDDYRELHEFLLSGY